MIALYAAIISTINAAFLIAQYIKKSLQDKKAGEVIEIFSRKISGR